MNGFSEARLRLSTLSEADLKSIAGKIETDGIYSVADFLSNDELLPLQAFVAAQIEQAGSESVSLDREGVASSGLGELVGSQEFTDFIRRLYSAGYGPPSSEFQDHRVLRCLTGKSAASHSMNFHYDSFMITALIPIVVPSKGLRGDFLIIPNTRHMRSRYLFNLVDKVLLDNALTQRRLRRRASNGGSVKRVSLTPGNLYLFWGYRSIHTNESVDEDMVRATALFHFADPHANSFLKRQLGRS